MNEQKEEKVRLLAEALFAKQERVRMMGMQNTAADPDVRRQEFIDWHVAKAEEFEALAALNEAMKA